MPFINSFKGASNVRIYEVSASTLISVHNCFSKFRHFHLYFTLYLWPVMLFSHQILLLQVFYVDQWFLSLAPVRYLLLRSMRPKEKVVQDDEMKKVVYAFGDSYDFRKELHITNVLTGYMRC